jgi:hypothetical protein
MDYKIDQSCEEKDIKAEIQAAMISAFEIVNSAYALLNLDPVDVAMLELLGFLFAKDGVDPAQLLANGKVAKTLDILRAIDKNMRTEVVGDATPKVEDVVGRTLITVSCVWTMLMLPLDHILPLRPFHRHRQIERHLPGYQYETCSTLEARA